VNWLAKPIDEQDLSEVLRLSVGQKIVSQFYPDVSGDNFITPIDVLHVVNYLNRGPATNPEGELGDITRESWEAGRIYGGITQPYEHETIEDRENQPTKLHVEQFTCHVLPPDLPNRYRFGLPFKDVREGDKEDAAVEQEFAEEVDSMVDEELLKILVLEHQRLGHQG
jgi:hypothetical protein